MGVLTRMSTVVKAKMNRLLDQAENPAETLDYAYEKQMEMLRDVKRGVVEMVTTKRRLELQASKVKETIITLDEQAKRAMAAGREDLARLALQRKQAAMFELNGLDQQVANLELEQEKLTKAEQRLKAKVDAFRTRKEIVKAQYSAAQAQERIGSALSGISEEMGDVQLSIERAETKTEQLRARAGAIDELAEAGVLEDYSGRGDPIAIELAKISAEQNVEDELSRIRTSLPSGEKRALPDGGRAMIVRILTEGQFQLPGAYIDELNEIDNRLVEVVEVEDEEGFNRLLKEMLDLVRNNGRPVGVDELVESDVVLPEPDITLVEAEELFTGEGLLPG